MNIKETILPLADAYAIEKWADAMHERQIKGDSNKTRAALVAALDAADRDVERLKDEIFKIMTYHQELGFKNGEAYARSSKK